MTEYQKFSVSEQKTYSTTDYKPYKPKDPPIDAGIYEAMITGLAWRDNSKKNGKYLLVSVTVLNDALLFPETRTILHYLNLQNPHDFARSKATEEFTQLLAAINIADLDYHPEKGPAPHEYKRIIFQPLKVLVVIKDKHNQKVNLIEAFYGTSEAEVSQRNNAAPTEFTSPPPQDEAPPPTSSSNYDDLNDNIPF